MRKMLVVVAGVVGVAWVSQARAQEQAQVSAVHEPEHKAWLGGQMGLSPIGSLEASASNGGNSATLSNDASTAFELGGRFEYRVNPNISIGAAPGIVFHIQGTNGNDSATALDLPLRISAGGDVAPQVRLYGFAAPGYSILFPPSGAMGNASGFMFGLGGGMNYQVMPRLAVVGELGYQWRFLSTEQSGIDVSLHANYLTFTVGLVTPVD